MSLNNEKTISQKIYNNYTVGISTMLVAIFLPLILPILGNFIAPFLYLAGIVAVLMSKINWTLKVISILVPLIVLIIFWNEYVSWIMTYLDDVTGKYQS